MLHCRKVKLYIILSFFGKLGLVLISHDLLSQFCLLSFEIQKVKRMKLKLKVFCVV